MLAWAEDMEYYHIILFLLATAIAVSAFADKIPVPYPVLLILSGIGIGFIPGLEYVPVGPDIVFLIFLPPLLYDAAIKTSFPEFRKNIRTISMLAVTMVFVTMTAIAVASHYIIPGMSWPVAFVVGAILSPPDAIAATGIIKNMDLPDRTKAILEGESLVNDASALTAYRIAVGVVAGGAFVFWNAALEFVLVIVGGGLVGAVLAYGFVWFLEKVPLQSNATVTLSILLPFVAYQLAESFGVSGVLAVVTMGLLIAKNVHSGKIYSQMTINQSRSVWSVIIYALSGLVFILIGLEFPQVLRDMPEKMIGPLLLNSFLIFLIALVIRILFIFQHKWSSDKILMRLRKNSGPEDDRRKEVRSLDWKNALVIGWSGMRGIVSVATAVGLPVVMSNGDSFPQRNAIIFLTVSVVILMLLIQGIGLPLLIKVLKIDQGDKPKEEM